MSKPGILQQVNETTISPEEMDAYLRAMEEDTREPSFERGLFIAREVFARNAAKCMSVHMRMTALSKLIEDEALPGWVKPRQEDGSYKVAANVYMAAGLEPLVEEENDWGFNRDSLLRRAFNLGKQDA